MKTLNGCLVPAKLDGNKLRGTWIGTHINHCNEHNSHYSYQSLTKQQQTHRYTQVHCMCIDEQCVWPGPCLSSQVCVSWWPCCWTLYPCWATCCCSASSSSSSSASWVSNCGPDCSGIAASLATFPCEFHALQRERCTAVLPPVCWRVYWLFCPVWC